MKHCWYETGPVRSDAELAAVWSIDAASYQEAALPLSILNAWWSAYPEGLTCVRRNDILLGAMGIWPISGSQYDQFRAGNIREADLTPHVHLDDDSIAWYISGFAITKSAPRRAVYELVKGVGERFVTSPPACPMSMVALGWSGAGMRILDRFGFTNTVSPDVTADRQPLYELLIRDSNHLSEFFRKRS